MVLALGLQLLLTQRDTTLRLARTPIPILLLIRRVVRGALRRRKRVVREVRLLHNALQLVLEVQQHQRVAPPSPASFPSGLSAPLGRPAIQQKIIQLVIIEVQQSVQKGRDVERRTIMVDRRDFRCGVAFERTLS